MIRLSAVERGMSQAIRAKLGRCLFCMRAAGVGTMAFAVAAGVIYLTGLPTWLLLGAIGCAGAFGASMIAHLVAFIWRYCRWMGERRCPNGATDCREPMVSRREVMAGACRAGFAATVFMVAGKWPASAQAAPCPGVFAPGTTIYGVGNSEEEARADLVRGARFSCEGFCNGRACNGPTCKRAGEIGLLGVLCGDDGSGGFRCEGRLAQCPCGCFECTAKTAPPQPDSFIAAGADNQADARQGLRDLADAVCDEFCKSLLDCQGDKRCLRRAPAQAKIDCNRTRFGGILCTGVITRCNCGCK